MGCVSSILYWQNSSFWRKSLSMLFIFSWRLQRKKSFRSFSIADDLIHEDFELLLAISNCLPFWVAEVYFNLITFDWVVIGSGCLVLTNSHSSGWSLSNSSIAYLSLKHSISIQQIWRYYLHILHPVNLFLYFSQRQLVATATRLSVVVVAICRYSMFWVSTSLSR